MILIEDRNPLAEYTNKKSVEVDIVVPKFPFFMVTIKFQECQP